MGAGEVGAGEAVAAPCPTACLQGATAAGEGVAGFSGRRPSPVAYQSLRSTSGPVYLAAVHPRCAAHIIMHGGLCVCVCAPVGACHCVCAPPPHQPY